MALYVYDYDDNITYTFHNLTTDQEETHRVKCACAQYAVCGCASDIKEEILDEIIGNGSYAALDKDVVVPVRVNGHDYLLNNGTLSNGTTADSNSDEVIEAINETSAGLSIQDIFKTFGLWPVVSAASIAILVHG
jgi:hypothetical protein